MEYRHYLHVAFSVTQVDCPIYNRSPESLRDVRGFAIKFYTKEGNFDMVCFAPVQFF